METKYLGIDYGLKRVGISVSDNSKKYAFQRDHLLNDNKFFDKLLELIRKESISKIVIGYPLRFNSEKTHSTEDVESFREKLSSLLSKNSLDAELIFFDERLTSSLASYNLESSGLSKKKRQNKGLVDSISAQIILQDYIDSVS
ncbi:MAG: Holliday junction resolvase RuvX [Ignavibacteria bacterium]